MGLMQRDQVQTSRERVPVVIVGGGQAGLSAGYHLARRGVPFVILDAAQRTGDSWRMRWDSLRLFTPSHLDGLDGMLNSLVADLLLETFVEGLERGRLFA